MILMSTVEQSRSMGTIENPEARGTKRMPYTLQGGGYKIQYESSEVVYN